MSDAGHSCSVSMKTTTERLGVRFDVCDRYVVQDVIGRGSHGIVCSATDGAQRKVAIKKIWPFEHASSCIRTIREIRLLRHFQHENIISILDVEKPRSMDEFSEVYIIQDFMEIDMATALSNQEFSPAHCQYFCYQILRGLKALHSAGIVHRDLKPANILLNSDCDLKICDFGLARSVTSSNDAPGLLTEYVVTRWYRAPEVMLSPKQYTKAIDVWSVGCILVEMFNGTTLFRGKDYLDQLNCIFNILGTPHEDDLQNIGAPRAGSYVKQLQSKQRRRWQDIVPRASSEAQDLIAKFLAFDYHQRITVDTALQHSWLKDYHDPNDEPTAEPLPPDWELETARDSLNGFSLKSTSCTLNIHVPPLIPSTDRNTV